MNAWDIKQVWIERLLGRHRLQGELQRKGEIVLSYDDTPLPPSRSGNWSKTRNIAATTGWPKSSPPTRNSMSPSSTT